MFKSLIKSLKPILLAAGLMALTATASVAQDFRVEGVGIEASPIHYEGICPGLITFYGKIQANGQGRVKYTYFRSDGGLGPEGFIDFEGPGVKYVTYTWLLGASELTHYEGWVAIRILSPNAMESNLAKFVMDCKPGPEPKPGSGEQAQVDSPGFFDWDRHNVTAREFFALTSPLQDLLDARAAARRSFMNAGDSQR